MGCLLFDTKQLSEKDAGQVLIGFLEIMEINPISKLKYNLINKNYFDNVVYKWKPFGLALSVLKCIWGVVVVVVVCLCVYVCVGVGVGVGVGRVWVCVLDIEFRLAAMEG